MPASEINRLASVPDLVDDDSPVELPLITPSGPIVAHPQSVYSPVLAETLYVPMPARQPTTTAAAMVAESKPPRRRAGRKPKRHLFRSFVTLVLLFGLLAGGAFAAKKYLLQQPEWSAELKPLADEVAAARALQFEAAVEVSELPVGDYAARLAGSTADVQAGHAPAWRSLGLLNGEFDLESIGRQAMNDSPAFYDPASKTIYVSDDLVTYEHLYRFAMRRALTAALLDQQFDWSAASCGIYPCGRVGIACPHRCRCAGDRKRAVDQRRPRSAGTGVESRLLRATAPRPCCHPMRRPSSDAPGWRCNRRRRR